MAEINAGLGSLAELKAFLLAASMAGAGDTANDANLTRIGLGVAGMFEEHCNRTWAYDAAAVTEFPANRSFILAKRYPLNLAVPLIVERSDSLVGGVQVWTPIPDGAYNVAADTGIVYLAGYQGSYLSRIRLTSAGGFWWEGLDANPIPPAGAAVVPPALKLAWLIQCQALWTVRDDLGIAIAGTQAGQQPSLTLPAYDLVPEVANTLHDFIRYSMSG